jgi:hypothetical protein
VHGVDDELHALLIQNLEQEVVPHGLANECSFRIALWVHRQSFDIYFRRCGSKDTNSTLVCVENSNR